MQRLQGTFCPSTEIPNGHSLKKGFSHVVLVAVFGQIFQMDILLRKGFSHVVLVGLYGQVFQMDAVLRKGFSHVLLVCWFGQVFQMDAVLTKRFNQQDKQREFWLHVLYGLFACSPHKKLSNMQIHSVFNPTVCTLLFWNETGWAVLG